MKKLNFREMKSVSAGTRGCRQLKRLIRRANRNGDFIAANKMVNLYLQGCVH